MPRRPGLPITLSPDDTNYIDRRPSVKSRIEPLSRRALAARSTGKIAGEVIDDVPGVVLRAMDEGRFATTEDRQPHRIQPWRIDDAAVVPQMPLPIDDGNIQPAVVRAKAGCPDDRTDLAAREVERE